MAHHQQPLSRHHSLQLNTTTHQRDTQSHNQGVFCQLHFYTTSDPLHYQHTTLQHGLARSSVTSTIQPSLARLAFRHQCSVFHRSHINQQHSADTTVTNYVGYSLTNSLTLPQSHAQHSRTRSCTTRKHRSTSRHRRRRRSTKRHRACHTSRHRSTTPRHLRHTSQHCSPILRSRSNS